METTLLKEILSFLEANIRQHYICEGDGWYNCPASGECYNDDLETECTCGANEYNKEANELISKIKKQLKTK